MHSYKAQRRGSLTYVQGMSLLGAGSPSCLKVQPALLQAPSCQNLMSMRKSASHNWNWYVTWLWYGTCTLCPTSSGIPTCFAQCRTLFVSSQGSQAEIVGTQQAGIIFQNIPLQQCSKGKQVINPLPPIIVAFVTWCIIVCKDTQVIFSSLPSASLTLDDRREDTSKVTNPSGNPLKPNLARLQFKLFEAWLYTGNHLCIETAERLCLLEGRRWVVQRWFAGKSALGWQLAWRRIEWW